jgi:hypothetical protein
MDARCDSLLGNDAGEERTEGFLFRLAGGTEDFVIEFSRELADGCPSQYPRDDGTVSFIFMDPIRNPYLDW